MSALFRLQLYRTQNGVDELVGYSRALDLIEACQAQFWVRRATSLSCELLPTTKPLEREFEAFWKTHQVASTLQFCNCTKCQPVIFLAVSPETPTLQIQKACADATASLTIEIVRVDPPQKREPTEEERRDGK